jgi:hypothetical protein
MHDEERPSGVEPLLQRLFAPVEPPERLGARVEARLQSISQLAADELDGWELAAMRDPRNWVRPALAVLGGSAAAAGLVLLGLQRRHRAGGHDDSHSSAQAGGGSGR